MTAITRYCGGFLLFLSIAAAAPPAGADGPQDIRLTVGKSIIIDYPADIRTISTSNADVVDASPVDTREILIHGKAFGTVTLIIWSKSGQREFYNITVEQNLDPLRSLLKETFPKEDIHIQSSRDSLSLTGRVTNKDVSDRAAALSVPFAKNIVNNLQVAGPPVEKQIVLHVKFAELDRTAASQFAVNIVSTGATNTIGSVTTGQTASPTPTTIGGGAGAANSTFSITSALNIFAFRPDLNLGALLQALQTQSLVQILAEPSLVTTNGKEASFLEGGEFPIPVLQGGANSGAITIQFREFGVRLSFTPFLTEHNTIRMAVKPEVSDLDFSHAVSFNGFTIPALATRKMDTTIELGENQSFVIAGLIDNRVTDSMAKIPGLANLPILGALFKSKNLNKSNTELIVTVTPEITMPLQPGDVKPNISMPAPFLTPVNPPPGDKSAKKSKS
jgi:pilus assembly protein CpaC